jgi:hypothetical protein
MVKSKHLNIQVIAYEDGGEILVNGQVYFIHPTVIKTQEDLRSLLSSQPDYVYNAVVGLLEQMQ